MNDEFDNDPDGEDLPFGYPSLEEVGEFIEEPRYILYFVHEPDLKFGSDKINVRLDSNMLMHHLMMRMKNIDIDTAMGECCRILPSLVILDMVREKQFTGEYERIH